MIVAEHNLTSGPNAVIDPFPQHQLLRGSLIPSISSTQSNLISPEPLTHPLIVYSLVGPMSPKKFWMRLLNARWAITDKLPVQISAHVVLFRVQTRCMMTLIQNQSKQNESNNLLDNFKSDQLAHSELSRDYPGDLLLPRFLFYQSFFCYFVFQLYFVSRLLRISPLTKFLFFSLLSFYFVFFSCSMLSRDY